MNEDLRTREYCLEILLSVLYKEEQSHILLKNVLDKCDDWEPARKAFLKKLTMGVLERKEELTYVLSQYMKKGSRIKPVTLGSRRACPGSSILWTAPPAFRRKS